MRMGFQGGAVEMDGNDVGDMVYVIVVGCGHDDGSEYRHSPLKKRTQQTGT